MASEQHESLVSEAKGTKKKGEAKTSEPKNLANNKR